MTDTPTLLVYGAAFLTGLLGSAHCLGMCGSLVSAFFMRPGLKGWGPAWAYHGARLAIYAVLGLAAAALGSTLASSGQVGMAQAVLKMVAGALIILLGLELLGLWQLRIGAHFAPFRWMGQGFGKALRRGPLLGAAMAGALNGCMPCSMTMAMAAKASALPPLSGMLVLLAFGAGTLPSMLSASWLLSRLGGRARGWLLKAAGLLVLAMGAYDLWKGIGEFRVLYKLLY
ncbi:MAG: sulfite exporter TauE/SafE family protein [Cystobacterineae bacterium]|nr:sulfite exporter TauE/SafE family protein [Cystobacterineae bacterium]